MINKQQKNKSIKYNYDVKKWFHFAIETLIMSLVGALIAFFFEGSWWIGFAVFGFLVLSLLIYLIVLVVNDHKVSITAIMKSGLRDNRYEDVIIYGHAMSPTLFTSNQNKIRVQLGEFMLEAVKGIMQQPFNKQKGKYLISIDKELKTLAQINAELLIDDVGWSKHLADKDDVEAIKNIITGMKFARKEVQNYLKDENIPADKRQKLILPFAKIVIKAYRHLSGIYYENSETLDKARHIENIVRIIMSNKVVLIDKGVCAERMQNICDFVGGIYCKKVDKIGCIRKNIKNMYFDLNKQSDSPGIKINQFFDFYTFGDISEADIEADINMFNILSEKDRKAIIIEQCYAWSRNIVKKLPKLLHMRGDNFISDEEWEMQVAEALAYAQIYYFGPDDTMIYQYETIANQEIIGKKELRYLRLLCEISLCNLQQHMIMEGANEIINSNLKNDNIDKVISMLETTRELCRGKRAELFVRSSANLINAYKLSYNLNYRFSLAKDCREARSEKIREIWKKITNIRQETRKYEHRDDYKVEIAYAEAYKEYRLWKKELNRKLIFKEKNNSNDEYYLVLNTAAKNKIDLMDKLPPVSEDTVNKILCNWRASNE